MNIQHKSGLAFTIPAAWYHQTEIYERERQQVFRREWIWLGRAGQLRNPGDYLAVDIAGWHVFVICDRDGGLRGFHNVCRHRAGPLVEDGAGHCDLLRCRYHGWIYDTSGKLRRTPDFGESPEFDKAQYSQFPIRVAIWRGFVFVNLDPAAGPLEAGLGDLVKETGAFPIEDFSYVHEESFDMNCNWKTYTDNFVEGYHIPGIHPAFHAVIDFERFTAEGRNRTVIMAAPQKDGSFYGGTWLWRYPNMTLSVFPDGMNISRIMPLGPGRMRQTYNFLFRDVSPAVAAKNRDTIARNCEVIRQDFGICETAQANLEAGVYECGPLSPRHEDGVRHFHDLLRQSLGAA
ncbi:MAG: aromatic ring-hydroxylating oxygenase subunit alpha [Dongiaceae bacterium]